MKEPIAYCGIDCSDCDAFIATQNNDQSLREKTAKEWGILYENTYTPDMINCSSCKGSGVLFGHCSRCKIRRCALERSVEHCDVCGEFKTCKLINDFIAWVPGVAANQKEKFKRLLG